MTMLDLTLGSPGRRVVSGLGLSALGLALYGYGPLLLVAAFVAVPWLVGGAFLAVVLTGLAVALAVGDCGPGESHDDTEHGVGHEG